MPRIAKYREKMECVKPYIGSYWYDDVQYKYAQPSEYGIRAMRIPDKFLDQVMQISKITWPEATSNDKKTIFDLIEDIVTDTLSSRDTDSEFFKDFVEIKEVPYGRYNSDTNN